MSGGFRDSFTRDDTKDDLLGYDDTAFYYFVVSVLTCVALPWTLSVLHNAVFPGGSRAQEGFPEKSSSGHSLRHCHTSEMFQKTETSRMRAGTCTVGSASCRLLEVVVLAVVWSSIYCAVAWLGQEKEIKQFDPFGILDVPPHATNREIKRAYRRLSLVYHPDKNTDNPLAASRFGEITRAVQALTDEIGKRNWEKYGNPDGPQATRVGIGLPRLLLEKQNHLVILCVFFFALLFVAPAAFICYFQRARSFAANGVMVDTLQFLMLHVKESTCVECCPELLAACAESRSMAMRPTDDAHMNGLASAVVEHGGRSLSIPIVVKNQRLIWAHMQRRHHLMSPELRHDCEVLVKHSMRITQAMVEIACMREWFAAARAMIEFRRCLVQALDVKSSELLQVPHISEGDVARCLSCEPPISTLADFVAMGPEQRRLVVDLGPQQVADIEGFCSHVGDVSLEASIEVEDERDIVVGDVATVTVQMGRTNLHAHEAIGPAHAPLFPEAKLEEWWFFLVETAPKMRIIHFERTHDIQWRKEEKLRFQVMNRGSNTIVVHALCDSYAGLDREVELSFHASTEDEVRREYPSYEEEVMGLSNEQEESDDENTRGDRKDQRQADTHASARGSDTRQAAARDRSCGSSSESD